MALEIERRFLIDQTKLPHLPNSRFFEMTQGYLGKGVRVRLSTTHYTRLDVGSVGNTNGYLTVKRTISHGTNKEFEYEIPSEDAAELLAMCEFTLTKMRYHYPVGRHIFEIDLFTGSLNGLVIGEIELGSIDEAVDIPSWFGVEITGNSDFSNSQLALMPDKNEILDYARD